MVALQPDDNFVSHWNDDDDDHDNVSVFPSSAPEILIETTPTTTKKRKSGKCYSIFCSTQDFNCIDPVLGSNLGSGNKRSNKRSTQGGTTLLQPTQQRSGSASSARKWEQKQVQIKTLEGEFSVTMWATGTDEGKSQPQPHHTPNSLPLSAYLILINFNNILIIIE